MRHGTAVISTPLKPLPTRRLPAPRQAIPTEHSVRSVIPLWIGEQRFLQSGTTTRLSTENLYVQMIIAVMSMPSQVCLQ